jgi:predicted AlkP superfamily pyrophosphatase or phosphodiesterase
MARILPRNLGQTGDVGFGLADLSQSIFSSLGLPDAINSLQLSESRRSCLLLVDGLGAQALQKFGSAHPVFQQVSALRELRSDFPSTTVTNLTSLGTGKSAGEHGMVGYTVRVPNSGNPGRLLNGLKWDERVDPLSWQKIPTLFQRASEHGISVSTIGEKRYQDTAFTTASLRGAKYLGANRQTEIVAQVKIALAEPASFAYVYVNGLDAAGHKDGVGSDKWLVALEAVGELILQIVNQLPKNTQFFITADHGMVNPEEKIILGRDNPLMNHVTLVGGEPRARHIYLEPGSETDATSLWREFLRDQVVIHTKQEAIDVGLFGEIVSDDCFARIGDLIAIPSENVLLIDPTRSAQESAMVGHHGGLTNAEVVIPLLTAQ